MKKIVKIFILAFFATWMLLMGLQILIRKSRGRDIDLVERGISAAILSLAPFVGTILGAYSVFPRSKYLESSELTKPIFKVACSSVIDMPKDFEFSRLKTEIAEKWVITFSDEIAHVLKFRAKWGLSKNWGAAAWLKYDNDTGKLYLEYFPMVATQNDLARKMQKEIECCLKPNEPT